MRIEDRFNPSSLLQTGKGFGKDTVFVANTAHLFCFTVATFYISELSKINMKITI